MKQICKTGLLLALGIIIGYLLLVMVFLLPTGRMYNNALESIATFQKEGDQNIIINDDTLATKTDNYTDALMLLSAINNSDKNVFVKAANVYHAAEQEKEPIDVLVSINNAQEHNAYGRYWHGYLLFLKPLLLLFNYNQIRVILSFVVLFLIIAVVYLLQKKKLDKYILPYSATIALIYPIAISLSMQFMPIFAISNLAIIFILLFFEKIEKNKNFFYIFLVIGMITCYFDFLTYPIVTLGFPLIVYLLLKNRKKSKTILENTKTIFSGSIGWGIGYFGIWVGKWIIGSFITGSNIFQSAISAANSRTSIETPLEQISRFDPIKKSFEMIFTDPVIFIAILLAIFIAILFIMNKIRINKEKIMSNAWLLIISIFPFAWYIVLANHSLWHIFFTYRTISVFIFAVGCYLISVIERTTKEKERNG